MALEEPVVENGMRNGVDLVPPSLYLRFVKPLLDLALVLVTLLVTLPMIGIIAVLVRATSPGPVFLRLSCVGRDGRTFGQLRFRVVHMDAASRQFRARTGGAASGSTDPRLTPMGEFLLRTQLNTLPQIFNVLLGHMSLVGPSAEPESRAEAGCAVQAVILRVRPGLFSPDHLSGCSALDRSERQAVALAYAAQASLSMDLQVLLAALRGASSPRDC